MKGGLAKRSHIPVSAESEVDGIDGVVGHVDDSKVPAAILGETLHP